MSTNTGSPIFINNLNVDGGNNNANPHWERDDERVLALFYKHHAKPSNRFPDRVHFFHRLCSLKEIGPFTGELENEREIIEVGKKNYQVNDGVNWSGTLTIKPDEWHTVAAMIGLEEYNVGGDAVAWFAAVQAGIDTGVVGDIILFSPDAALNMVASQIITNVRVKLLEAPGVGDNDGSYTISLSSEGEVINVSRGFAFVPFYFHDDGTGTGVTNTAAPDGALQAFPLISSNFAWPGAAPSAPLLAQIVRPNLYASGNPYSFLVSLRYNGVEVQKDQFTFDHATGTINTVFTPADGSILEGVVLLPTGFPDFDAGKQYGIGEVVWEGNEYKRSNKVTGPGALVALDWNVLTGQKFPLPLFHDDGAEYKATSSWQNPKWSWLQVGLDG